MPRVSGEILSRQLTSPCHASADNAGQHAQHEMRRRSLAVATGAELRMLTALSQSITNNAVGP